MHDSRFDAFARALGRSASRRDALKAFLGVGGVATVGALVFDDVDAARRGQTGPTAPTPAPTSPPPPTSTAAAPTQAPPTRIPPSSTPTCVGVLCNGTCCTGQCTSAGACCPAGSTVCGAECCPNGQSQCCDGACCYGNCYGEELCCPTGQLVCNGVCLPPGGCCTDGDCAVGRCLQNLCVPPTVTSTATKQPTTAPPTSTSTAPATATQPPTSTATATESATPLPTETATATETATPPPTETGTATETATETATATQTPIPSPTEVHYQGIISAASSALSGTACILSATASSFRPSAPITFALWGELPSSDVEPITTIDTTTDASGSASIQHTVDQHAYVIVNIVAAQELTQAMTRIALTCPDPTPVPPAVTISFASHPDDWDYCQATVHLTGFPPSSQTYVEVRLYFGQVTLGGWTTTDADGTGTYVYPQGISAEEEGSIEAIGHVSLYTTVVSSGVKQIAC